MRPSSLIPAVILGICICLAQESQHWYDSPEWVLVIIGAITAFVIGWQSYATQRAAKATEADVRLQKTAMRQWIHTENWRAKPSVPYCTGMSKNVLHVTFDIVNKTSYPLTLETMILKLNRKKEETRPLSYFLPPQNSFLVNLAILMDIKACQRYGEGEYPVMVECRVTYTDAFGEVREQAFSRISLCGPPDRSNFHAYTSDSVEAQEEQQDPN